MKNRICLPVAGVLLTVLASAGCSGAESSGCPVPRAAEVAEVAAGAATVAKVTFRKVAALADGTTETEGWLVEGTGTVKGPALGRPTAVWPTIDAGTPKEGERLVLFLSPHEGRTTMDGAAASGYDVVREGGVLVESGGGLARLCREGRSQPVPPEILG
ncbi:hypothetical protein [Actinomadura kijaniata]|uniref:hypothetical protein n=1 Tax=Actinomadura kijaniata TaxID=46161 RepID=UPI000835C6DB|nr:hypothetical protein [Actinomadura kijaniata]